MSVPAESFVWMGAGGGLQIRLSNTMPSGNATSPTVSVAWRAFSRELGKT